MSDLTRPADQNLIAGAFHGQTDHRPDGPVYSINLDVTHAETNEVWTQRLEFTAVQILGLEALLEFIIDDNELHGPKA